MSAITIGSTFLDRYRIDHVLGRGAYAKVFRAHQLDLGRDVALKVLSPMTNRPDKMAEARLRFEREAKLVARLQDPHTIHLFDWGHSPDGDMYMATELVDGQTLHDVWVDGDPMPWQRAGSRRCRCTATPAAGRRSPTSSRRRVTTPGCIPPAGGG